MPAITTHTKSSKLWFRMVVPERLRAKVGKSEVKFSLRTSDPTEAKLSHCKAQSEWRQRFLELDRELQSEQIASAPALVEQALAALTRGGRRDDTILALGKFLSFRTVVSWGRDFYAASEADYAFCGNPEAADWDDYEKDTEIDVVPHSKRMGFVARLRVQESNAETQGMGHRNTAVELLKSRRWELVAAEVQLIESITNVAISPGTAFYDTVAETFLKALINHKFKTWTHGSMAAFLEDEQPVAHPHERSTHVPIAADPAPPVQVATSGRTAVALSEALVLWRKMQLPVKQSDIEVSRAVARFIELFGDKPVDAITEDDIFSYRDLIQQMPANLQLSKIHASNKTLR